MGNRNSRWSWKFYYDQVTYVGELLEQYYNVNSQFKSYEEYVVVMERLGREPDPSKAPLEVYHFPLEVQEAFAIHAMLPDRWDGMSGTYMGKDWSALSTMLDIFNVEHKREVATFLKYIEHFNSKKINAEGEKQRKARERSSQAPGTKMIKG